MRRRPVAGFGSQTGSIYPHEVGRTFGWDDFCDWAPSGQCCFLMKAGSASSVWWRRLKSRYGR